MKSFSNFKFISIFPTTMPDRKKVFRYEMRFSELITLAGCAMLIVVNTLTIKIVISSFLVLMLNYFGGNIPTPQFLLGSLPSHNSRSPPLMKSE